MKLTNFLAAFITLIALGLARASASPVYSVTPLGTLSGSTSSRAYAINASGQVAGYSGQAFFYNGSMQGLGRLDNQVTRPSGINASGQVVGYAAYEMFLYDGAMHNLGTEPDGATYATGINNTGVIVGYTTVPYNTDSYERPFYYDGAFHHLPTPTGFRVTPTAINSAGQIVGVDQLWGPAGVPELPGQSSYGVGHAFLYDGTLHDLGVLFSGVPTPFSKATDINDAGLVVGVSTASFFGNHAFLYNGTMHDLGTANGFADSWANALNGSGQIVGYLAIDQWTINGHGFIYTDAMYDLNDLIDPASGWTIVNAYDINDNGWIAAVGTNPAVNGGVYQALILAPVPEPASAALLLAGAAGATALRRRRRKD